MNSAGIASSRDLSLLLSEPTLRHNLRAMVRRRVPAAEAEDIVQATLCDALSAARVPADPAEVPRWVTVIARNKIADHFRRAKREDRVEYAPVQALHEPVEERVVLGELLREAQATPAGIRTLGWVVREAGGEQLADIAQEENLSPAVVRQRVSRWRRRARTVFLLAAASLGLFVVVRALVAREEPLQMAGAPSRFDGAWRVVDANVSDQADSRLRTLAGGSLSSSRLVIAGGRGRFEKLGIIVERSFAFDAPPSGAAAPLSGRLTTADGSTQPFQVHLEGADVVVTGGGARFRLARE